MIIKLHNDNNKNILQSLDDNSVDSFVQDPPYSLGFMNSQWDMELPTVEDFAEQLRVAKPGCINFCFGGTRTFHRLAVHAEDAGWIIRDTIAWVYGEGMPKGLNIGKGFDKKAGKERTVISTGSSEKTRNVLNAANYPDTFGGEYYITEPATEEAKLWDGWNTNLRPCWEPILILMKPLDKNYIYNAEQWGVAGLNIDGCRIGNETVAKGGGELGKHGIYGKMERDKLTQETSQGRYPGNFIHDGSDEVLDLFPDTPKSKKANRGRGFSSKGSNTGWKRDSHNKKEYQNVIGGYDDEGGSAARFFYCAKSSPQERNLGLDKQNIHPTTKPITLMRHLVRLSRTPTGGIVLDPYMGSGSTGIACVLENRDFIGIEMELDYFEIAQKRIEYFKNNPGVLDEKLSKTKKERNKKKGKKNLF